MSELQGWKKQYICVCWTVFDLYIRVRYFVFFKRREMYEILHETYGGVGQHGRVAAGPMRGHHV